MSYSYGTNSEKPIRKAASEQVYHIDVERAFDRVNGYIQKNL